MMVGVWVKRSLRFYGARHAVFAGTVALATAILAAALLTGESLQAGLQRGLRERLGAIRSAVSLGEGVFPATLAGRLPGAQAALLLRGELLDADGAIVADNAQIIGVASSGEASGGEWRAALNARAGELVPDDRMGAVRFEKPSPYSVEMPLGSAKESRVVRRPTLFGRRSGGGLLSPDFAFQAASVPPVNAFLPFGLLSEAAGVPGMANALVSEENPVAFARALARALEPEDAGLVLESLNAPLVESQAPSVVVKSRRVFLPQAVLDTLTAAGLKTEPATFHLADAFEAGAVGSRQGQSAGGAGAPRSTPYGFVAAVTPGAAGTPGDLKDDEVVVNAWLAETLGVKAGDPLTIRWRRFEAGGRLAADFRAFRVREILPMERAARAKRLMPVFPGLEGVDSCAEWDVGLPMDAEKLKDAANEKYWKQWRETPKAFLTFAAGKACFGTVFGEAMSVRVAAGEAAVRGALRELTPGQLGFVVRPLWDEGVAVAGGSTDFKGLFVGMAFVLVASALLLAALSLALALERRKGEVALFSALGWRRGRIALALAAEWGVPLAAGALAGACLGATLARALVWGLSRFWRGAFAGADVVFSFSWPVAGLSAGVGLASAGAVLLFTVRRFSRCQPVELWRTSGTGEPVRAVSCGTLFWENLLGGALAVAALVTMALSPSASASDGAFFGAGLLLLISLLLFMRTSGAAWMNGRSAVGVTSPVEAGLRRTLLAPRRSAPVVVSLAVGIFLTTGIVSMKHDPADGCERSSSGSGGFASLVSSVAPMERARGLEMARRVSGSKGAVPVRVLDGDEAGCLNMNRPLRARLLGLDAQVMARSRAFEPEDAGGVWSALSVDLPDGVIPALAADQTMLQYSLKAKAGPLDGTTYDYPASDGRTVRVRVVGALPVRSGILQGALLIDERRFAEAFPDAGYRLWLCDGAPVRRSEGGGRKSEEKNPISDLRSRISDLRPLPSDLRYPEPGVTVETAAERLRLLGTVESTYLDMFLVLGGLGVALGVFGVALVILRGVEERRGELALLRALGLPRRVVVRMLAAEYGTLVAAGLVCGVVSALAAIQPSARSLGGQLPWLAMFGVIGFLLLCATVSVLVAARVAARRFGPEVLKEEV